MNTTVIKVLGIAASLIGIGATLVNDWVNEQKMNEMISEKVNEAMTAKNQEEDNENEEEE